jgi:hypothetical protein
MIEVELAQVPDREARDQLVEAHFCAPIFVPSSLFETALTFAFGRCISASVSTLQFAVLSSMIEHVRPLAFDVRQRVDVDVVGAHAGLQKRAAAASAAASAGQDSIVQGERAVVFIGTPC